MPVFFTLAWAIVTGFNVTTLCWFGYNHTAFYWIVEGPRLALIVVSIVCDAYVLQIDYLYFYLVNGLFFFFVTTVCHVVFRKYAISGFDFGGSIFS